MDSLKKIKQQHLHLRVQWQFTVTVPVVWVEASTCPSRSKNTSNFLPSGSSGNSTTERKNHNVFRIASDTLHTKQKNKQDKRGRK